MGEPYMNAFWTWAKAKFGRIVTAAGAVLGSVETFDISVIKDPIEGLFPKYGHQFVLGFTVLCCVLSYGRHQYVASKVAPKPEVLPPPVTQ